MGQPDILDSAFGASAEASFSAGGAVLEKNLSELPHGHDRVMGQKSFHEIHRPCFARMGAPLDGILRLE